jgi:hypothetical protein
VYLAYLDDSDTRSKGLEWQVISAVLIPADAYLAMEFMSASFIEELMPEDRRDRFEEFHACELYGDYGVFEGIDQDARFGAIRSLLSTVVTFDFKVAYGAVNLKLLSKKPLRFSQPSRCCISQMRSGRQRVDWKAGSVGTSAKQSGGRKYCSIHHG